MLQIHRLGRSVPIEETMKALNDFVENGKVRYIGASSVSGREARGNTMNNAFQAYIRGLTNHGEVSAANNQIS